MNHLIKYTSILCFVILAQFPITDVYGQEETYISCEQIEQYKDSLDAIHYSFPAIKKVKREVVVKVRNQNEWDQVTKTIDKLLKVGYKNILVKVIGKDIVYGKNRNFAQNWYYPDANIYIDGRKSRMTPYGVSFCKKNNDSKYQRGFYSYSYKAFNLNDIIVDSRGNEISLRETTRQVMGEIEEVKTLGEGVWRFRVDLPDLSEESCNDFYVLLTRDWTACRHHVLKVEKGFLYFLLQSDDAPSDFQNNLNPNRDRINYNVRPRYCLINNPVSDGIHITEGRIYVPLYYKEIKLNKGGQVLSFSNCHLNSLVISGFNIRNSGDGTAFVLQSCTFKNGAFIVDNKFSNLSSLAINTFACRNVLIGNNTIKKTRGQAIYGDGVNITICGNNLKDIGWMLNTKAITGKGDSIHICDNYIEDFIYGAIACGSAVSNENAQPLTYIIERNNICYSKEFMNNYRLNTLCDGGAIYIGPQNTRGIIRYNFIENIIGNGANRGIYLDDGGKNIAIYGNIICNTANSYDIDLRYCKTYSGDIPDHNTNNTIFNNIITGYYKFEGKNEKDNCFCGYNLLLNKSFSSKNRINLNHKCEDISIDGAYVSNGHIYLLTKYKSLVESFCLDNFIKDKIIFEKK